MLWLCRIFILHHFMVQILIHPFFLDVAVVWCAIHMTILHEVWSFVDAGLSPLSVVATFSAFISSWYCVITIFESGWLTLSLSLFRSRSSRTYILLLIVPFVNIIPLLIRVLAKPIMIIRVNKSSRLSLRVLMWISLRISRCLMMPRRISSWRSRSLRSSSSCRHPSWTSTPNTLVLVLNVLLLVVNFIVSFVKIDWFIIIRREIILFNI